jgi:hypothetical protein
MRFYQFRDWLLQHLTVQRRLQMVVIWYLISLMVDTRKHSLRHASTVSGLHASQFSKLLRHHRQVAASSLESLAQQRAQSLTPHLTALEGTPWTIALLIDSTLQGRAGLHTENSTTFNHGHGYVIGHQWTNIVLLLNGVAIPLPPIPFYSKNYCKAQDIVYATEHDRLVEYLRALHLEDYLGVYRPQDVVVLMDSGYDVKKIQKIILAQGWHFLGALKSNRGVKSPTQYANTPKSKDWTGMTEFFRRHRRIPWQTLSVPTKRPTKPRMEFRIRQTTGYLKGVGLVQLVCSEFKQRRYGRRKHLACSDLRATSTQIIRGYRLRWCIEIFHKQVKQHLGFDDVAPKHFHSVETHVSFVYCAYILLSLELPGIPAEARTLMEKQAHVKHLLDNRIVARILQGLTQFGGVEKYKDELKAVLSGK